MTNISTVLARNLTTPIEEVVKVSQTDDVVVRSEIIEYVATSRIISDYQKLLNAVADYRTPTERVGVWVSGFFGSGKSSFIKNLGYVLGNRSVLGEPAGRLFLSELQRHAPYDENVIRLANTLNYINQNLPILVIMFDVQVDLPPGRGADELSPVMYYWLLRALDYSAYADIAELEIELEGEDRLADFIQRCAEAYGADMRLDAPPHPAPPVTLAGRVSPEQYAVWRKVRDGAQRLARAARLLHDMDPNTYPTPAAAVDHTRVPPLTVRLLVDRTFELAARRKPGHGVAYVMDEVGRHVAHDPRRLENLRAVVEQFGQESHNRVGRLRNPAPSPVWVIVSSQEALEEVVSALGGTRIDVAKVQDRFPVRIDMVPADIREVATKRVLSKTADGEKQLHKLFDQHGALLKTHTRLSGTSRVQEATHRELTQFYPYLPHYIDLSIEIVSTLRLQSDMPRHVGGSNRTIIKQAYEMLTSERTRLADEKLGRLVTLDLIYDLLESNLGSDTRREIDSVRERAAAQKAGPMPYRVARALALLQHVRDLPRTEENLAALLYERLGDDSPLEEVRAAVAWLQAAEFIGPAEGGWKLLSITEKNWMTQRKAHAPTPRERNDILERQLSQLFTAPALSAYSYKGLRTLRVRADWNNRIIAGGSDISLRLRVADGPEELAEELQRAATESRAESPAAHLYWVFARDDELDEAIDEVARSGAMLARYRQQSGERILSDAEKVSVEGETRDLERHTDVLRRRLEEALAAGQGVFGGVRRNKSHFTPNRTHEEIFRGFYGYAVPDMYHKLEDGIRPKLRADDADKVLKAANLNGLPPIFYGRPDGFEMVTRGEGDKYVINVDAPILKELRAYIDSQTSFGHKVTGKGLEEHFARPPYGWELRALMPALATLLRGNAINVTYQGRRHNDHLDPQVHGAFAGPTPFRAASFAPRVRVNNESLVAAARQYEHLTGHAVDIEQTAIAGAFKKMAAEATERLRRVDAVLRANNMPGLDVTGEYDEFLQGLRDAPSDEVVVRMAQEGATFRDLHERFKRIEAGTSDLGLVRLRRLRRAAGEVWPALRGAAEPIATDEQVAALDAYTRDEAFYAAAREQDDLAARLEQAYATAYATAHDARAEAYAAALAAVRAQSDWGIVGDEALLGPLRGRDHVTDRPDDALRCRVCGASLAVLAADVEAVGQRRADVVARLHQLAAPPETRIERVRLVDVVGTSPALATRDDVDALLERLRDHLQPLVEAGIQVILE